MLTCNVYITIETFKVFQNFKKSFKVQSQWLTELTFLSQDTPKAEYCLKSE